MSATFRLRPFLHWLLAEPARTYATIGVPLLLTVACWYLPFKAELNVRIAGFFVTMAGIALVVHDIRVRGEKGEKPSFVRSVADWFSRLPTFFRKPKWVSATATIAVDGVRLKGTGTVRLSASADATPEQRIHVLEENLKSLEGQFADLSKRVSDTAGSLHARLDDTTSRYDRLLNQLASQLADLATGSLDLEAMGVLWVIIGTGLSTFPGELWWSWWWSRSGGRSGRTETKCGAERNLRR